ncbi:hypothetical protein EBU99_08440 [bacterium]|nr:hypothetical protein [bacterium]
MSKVQSHNLQLKLLPRPNPGTPLIGRMGQPLWVFEMILILEFQSRIFNAEDYSTLAQVFRKTKNIKCFPHVRNSQGKRTRDIL